MIMHLQAVDAFSTTYILRFGMFSGSLRYLPRLFIIPSSASSILYSSNSSKSFGLPNNFIEAAHQSTYIFRVSGFLTFYVGLGYISKHRAFITTLITFGGFFIAFNKSICFLSSTLRAS